MVILARLTNEILPFTSDDAQRFMDLYYFTADKRARETEFHQAFRLEQPIGAVNFIDKLVAREERHRLGDYKICLKLIDDVLRRRFPGLAPAEVSKDAYQDLYQQMANERWMVGTRASTAARTSSFNCCAATPTPVHSRIRNTAAMPARRAGRGSRTDSAAPKDESCFNWQRAIEPPLGASADYVA